MRELDVSYRQLHGPGFVALCMEVLCADTLPSLEALSLAFNDLDNGDIGTLARALPSLPRLAKLDVSYNPFQPQGAAALVAVLPALQHLSVLTLSQIEI